MTEWTEISPAQKLNFSTMEIITEPQAETLEWLVNY
jgi:hypothetical protein